ncbi:hypothetical protein OIU79_002575, partial [Salix purpurea]
MMGVFNGEGEDVGVFTVMGEGAKVFDGRVATGGDMAGKDEGKDEGDCAIVEAIRNVISIKKTMPLSAAIFMDG